MCGQARSKRIKLVVDVSAVPRDLRLYADETRIEQIMVNLLSNAVKFTQSGGQVTLRCAVVESSSSSRGCSSRPHAADAFTTTLDAKEADAGARSIITSPSRRVEGGGSRTNSVTCDGGEGGDGNDDDDEVGRRPLVFSVSVTDTGVGMTDEMRQRLFKPFTQVHDGGAQRQFGGTGLGLCISAKLAALMGCPQIEASYCISLSWAR